MDIGVIGGADGPTTIYVGYSIDWGPIIAAVILVAAVLIGVFIWRKKKVNKTT